ncbi:haloalkane dehalogenase [Hellea balneolensis]|uniref:haloalkane dehalogenase n=1 Tax=Hellea balneolensis TaxID=287478 RepID=UPI00041CA842|nr:haloalkane dehalogenase [Hellea balneolensis]
MKILRTPDSRFQNLPDYPFEPNYVTIGDNLRLHYVDHGPREGQLVIMMHGEPSWSFLYRHMITTVAAAGYRVIAPDLIGFGKSDKPAETSDYSYSRHVEWMTEWFMKLDVSDAVLFCQDWGGLLGLRLVSSFPERFAGVIAANTGLPTGEGTPSEAFLAWQKYSQTVPEFPVGNIINGATVTDLSPDIIAAYDAPYPNESYKAGARIFPALVPTSQVQDGAVENQKAWEVLAQFEKPFLTCFSDEDPVTGGDEKHFKRNIQGAKTQPHEIVEGGGHFLQEDVHAELSQIIIDFMKAL